MNPTTPAPQVQMLAGLPLTAWVVIAIAFLAVIILYHFWSIATAIGRRRAETAADLRAQKAVETRMNRALRHADPVEPAPLDYVRAGLPIPAPRSTALLAREVDDLKSKLAGGTGGAAPTIPTTSFAPSPTPSNAASGSAGTNGASTTGPSVAASPATAPSPLAGLVPKP